MVVIEQNNTNPSSRKTKHESINKDISDETSSDQPFSLKQFNSENQQILINQIMQGPVCTMLTEEMGLKETYNSAIKPTFKSQNMQQ
jgi:hypothetical protein